MVEAGLKAKHPFLFMTRFITSIIASLRETLGFAPVSQRSRDLQITINNVDHAPSELHEQTPFTVTLLKDIPGPDRPDYWLAQLHTPLKWIHHNREHDITHLLLAARWHGTRIEPDISNLPIGIAYVTDLTLLDDATLNFSKCDYVAIGLAHDTTGGKPIKEQTKIMAGNIGRSFGLGNP